MPVSHSIFNEAPVQPDSDESSLGVSNQVSFKVPKAVPPQRAPGVPGMYLNMITKQTSAQVKPRQRTPCW